LKGQFSPPSSLSLYITIRLVGLCHISPECGVNVSSYIRLGLLSGLYGLKEKEILIGGKLNNKVKLLGV
jgi:hypothetical protein